MEKHRAIPHGYMTTGEVAKKVGVTVRALQYYDKEGLLRPSTESEGGRRLYTHKELVKLQQILSLKELGFTLEEIKVRLPSITTPEEASDVLMEQAKELREKIITITNTLDSIEKLNREIMQTKTVDWEKYADIFALIRAKDESYWLMKHFSENVYSQIRNLDKKDADAIMAAQNQILEKASALNAKGIPPESKEGQSLAKNFWDLIMSFTKGDMSLIAELQKLSELQNEEWKNKMKYIEKAIDIYFTSLGYNPLMEVEKND